ncbi:hypothetical protein C8F04DRAFT_1202265 [Mycena alexandri]|uniref:Uncharacterized protein n=1 Tax=Mycena alexandri TaxID=1745969 RepID=A0AAD6RW38_9AGAR|nr:hypothetical protein C8F04DRAFT_1202265 [Mycena alexandri]
MFSFNADIAESSLITSPSATLRVYSGAGDAPLPDNTIVFAVTKAFAPAGKPVELDVLFLSVVPGNSNNKDYDASQSSLYPIEHVPTFIYGVGHIHASQPETVLQDGAKAFSVGLTDFVTGNFKSSTIQCIYPATRRWANVPTPHAQSCTQILGTCHGFNDSGLLKIALIHVTLSLAPHTLAQPTVTANTAASTSPATPLNRKKYNTMGSTTPAQITPTDNNKSFQSGSSFHAASLDMELELPETPETRHNTRCKKLKRKASESLSPPPDDGEILEIPDDTPVKGKGKGRAK